MVGLVYLCMRIYHFNKKAGLERELLAEEIISKQQENHKNNTFKQFQQSLKEDNHENLKK